MVQSLRENAHQKDYLPVRGHAALREAVADYHCRVNGVDRRAEDVLIGPGSKELMFILQLAFYGDLLVPSPSWVSYTPQAHIAGRRFHWVDTQPEHGWRLQPEELEAVCLADPDRPRILILNYPSNPLGVSYTGAELAALARTARRFGLVIVSDEIYGELHYQGDHVSMAQYYPEGTIVTGGLSKSFSAGGYRLGVMLIPQALGSVMGALKSIVSETFSAVSAPIQYAALAAYGNFQAIRPQIDKTCEIHRFIGHYVYDRFIAMGLNCPPPEGAFYLFPDFDNFRESLRNRGILTGMRLSDALLDQARVALLPGSDFYLPSTHLGVRATYVDYDGATVLDAWPGIQNMTPEKTRQLFPSVVAGCDSLERFLQDL